MTARLRAAEQGVHSQAPTVLSSLLWQRCGRRVEGNDEGREEEIGRGSDLAFGR